MIIYRGLPGGIVIKLSGEVLKGPHSPFSENSVEKIVESLHKACDTNRLAIVIGGGNIIRSRNFSPPGVSSPNIDLAGMAATLTNSLVLKASLEASGVKSMVMTSGGLASQGVEPYDFGKARRWLDENDRGILVLAGGTGRAGVSTDTAAVISAHELGARLVIKVTNVDGIYNQDPELNSEAERFCQISYQEFLRRRINTILDPTAVTLARQHQIKVFVCHHQLLRSIGLNEEVKGTLVGQEF